jgi:non-heme chloroperoxidase
MSSFQAGMLTVAPDFALSYAEQGNALGPAVVLLHGYSDSWLSFRPLMELLPSSLRVIALSMRGHGDSSKPSEGYRIGSFAADVIGAMDVLGITKASVVGHSMGSLVAERIAIDYPNRVSKLALIGAFATVKDNAAVEALWCSHIAEMRDPVDPLFARAFQQSTVTTSVAPDFLDSVVAESLKVPAHVWRSTLRSLLDDDHSHRLPEIAAPTRIIWGDQDPFADRFGQELLIRKIPGARLTIHAGIGHAPHWEDPRRIADELAAFVKVPARLVE